MSIDNKPNITNFKELEAAYGKLDDGPVSAARKYLGEAVKIHVVRVYKPEELLGDMV